MMNLATQWYLEPRPHVYSKVAAEFLACMLFHFIGSISATPWGNAVALMCLVFFSAKTSGGILNPALTLTFCLLGHTNPLEMVLFWIGQISGCIIGALWVALLVPGLGIGDKIDRAIDSHDGCFIPHQDLTRAGVFGWEAVGSFGFFICVMTVVYYSLRKKGYGNVGPIMVGLSLMAHAFALGPFTGGAMNPARVLGSFAVFDCGNDRFVGMYIAGQVVAAVMAALAVVPWYGIATDAWYMTWIPMNIRKRMKNYQPSLQIGGDVSRVDVSSHPPPIKKLSGQSV